MTSLMSSKMKKDRMFQNSYIMVLEEDGSYTLYQLPLLLSDRYKEDGIMKRGLSKDKVNAIIQELLSNKLELDMNKAFGEEQE